MSSHHIVREKQEPALLILGLNDFPEELLGQLLEWSPTVVATPQTAEILLANGIKIDWLITNGSDNVYQSDVKMMSCGEHNLTDAALKFLSENEYPAVNIITDELNLDDYLHFAGNIDLVIFHQHRKIFPVSSGFSKWKPTGEIIEILTPITNPTLTGLSGIGHKKHKTNSDGLISLYFDDAFIFIAEEL